MGIQARGTIILLAAIQALSVSAGSIILALGTIVGADMVTDGSYATLPYALLLFGALICTVPASRLMFAFGRKVIFLVGAGVGCVSGILMAIGAAGHNFLLFSLGAFLWGPNAAIILYYRFAATEAVAEGQKGRAISYVLSGSIIGVFLGPTVALRVKDIIPGWEYFGSFAFISFQCVLVAVLLFCTQLMPPYPKQDLKGRLAAVVFLAPGIFAGVANSIVAFGVMVLIMTAAPLAIIHFGHGMDMSVTAIQWHLCAMYAPSYVAGILLDRFGAVPVSISGMLFFVATVVVSCLEPTAFNFTLALILLGIGWNFMFMSGTYLLSKHGHPDERSWVQAVNELLCGSIVALAAFLAGVVFTHVGWNLLVISSMPLLGLSLAATLRALLRQRRSSRSV
ncbi:MFS transporter [Rhizobium sp. 768_B6_N1_8]|uniref:MFS transporter n=1 Tax=unclassified Rhizobium TaxID=2613769 RepID=UPI003F1FD6A8